MSKLHIIGAAKRPNDSPGVALHKKTAVAKSGDTTLVVISKVIHGGVTSVGSSSVRSVRILGSTTSATVCNTHTGKNIVLVRAGGNGRKGMSIGCGFGVNVGFTHGKCRCLGTNSCLCCAQLKFGGTGRTMTKCDSK